MAVFYFLGLILAIFVVYMSLPNIPTVPTNLILVIAFGIVSPPILLVFAHRVQTIARRLVLYSNEVALAIQTVHKSGRVESEQRAALTECRMLICPVKLESRQGGISFSGWMARVEVCDRCFTLACCKTQKEVLEYVQRLPSGLIAISRVSEEPIVGCMIDRRFGNRAQVIRP